MCVLAVTKASETAVPDRVSSCGSYLFVFHRESGSGEAGHVRGEACHSGHQKPAGQDLQHPRSLWGRRECIQGGVMWWCVRQVANSSGISTWFFPPQVTNPNCPLSFGVSLKNLSLQVTSRSVPLLLTVMPCAIFRWWNTHLHMCLTYRSVFVMYTWLYLDKYSYISYKNHSDFFVIISTIRKWNKSFILYFS